MKGSNKIMASDITDKVQVVLVDGDCKYGIYRLNEYEPVNVWVFGKRVTDAGMRYVFHDATTAYVYNKKSHKPRVLLNKLWRPDNNKSLAAICSMSYINKYPNAQYRQPWMALDDTRVLWSWAGDMGLFSPNRDLNICWGIRLDRDLGTTINDQCRGKNVEEQIPVLRKIYKFLIDNGPYTKAALIAYPFESMIVSSHADAPNVSAETIVEVLKELKKELI